METTDANAPNEGGPAVPRPRITNACEACRSAKVKCQASNQLGICKSRCLDSKRECVFKTGPRTRRPRQSKRYAHYPPCPLPQCYLSILLRYPPLLLTPPSPDAPAPKPLPPPSGPSKTFTIDISMPPEQSVTSNFEELRLTHEDFINRLVPGVSSGSDDDDDDEAYDFDMGDADAEWLRSTASHAGSSASHASSLPLGASALSTPPSSVAPSRGATTATASASASAPARTVASALGVRPTFNLDSATSLLVTFRDVMLPNFPCIVLPPESTVSDLARERPFVLLAVLAVASSTRTLQGHSLYDEEFRKILGLKFVAGGERSIELLEGLVVYVAWYPFHLRPKNKQAFQYIRMAVDVIIDLELDQQCDSDDIDIPPTPERMDQIRLYLATYFMVSHQSTAWARSRPIKYTAFTGLAIDIFQRHSTSPSDMALSWKARLQRLVEETNELRKAKKKSSAVSHQSEYQTGLVLRGIESQLTEWESKIPPAVASQSTIRITVMFTRLFITAAPLFSIPTLKPPSKSGPEMPGYIPTQDQLLATVPTLHAMLEFFLSLPAGEVNAFCGADWGSLILAIVLGYRLSFPLADHPDWDDAVARRAVGFGAYLDRLCRMGDGSDSEEIMLGLPSASQPPAPATALRHSMDVLSASKVVIGVVRDKFRKRVRKLEGPPPPPAPPPASGGIIQNLWAAATGSGKAAGPVPMPASHPPVIPGTECPMLDGSIEPYYPYWDETFSANHLDQGGFGGGDAGSGVQQQQHNDLWSTISMGWAQDSINFEAL
ncbi:hypothetical protein B0T14DRAFT_419444 [Immersiella caudata]|uniref:Zn(2)-C6 fungal-type domain-containing protein n=1 Tax=Immersiella caudata TaxID=314043 RepID=A0AA39XE24_9PEZI|nr:hypothetical protein B0T14DRAFT_419444 [Immersiella caudata]